MGIKLEDILNEVRYPSQIETSKNVLLNGNLTVLGTTTIQAIVQTNLTATGNTVLGDAVTDTTTITGATTIQSTSATAFSVGAAAAGATGAFVVDASTASQVTGLTVVGAATGGTVAINVTQAAGNANLSIDAKGSGTITLNGTGTGNIVLSRAMTGVSVSVTGAVIAKSATSVPATAGAVAAGAPLVMNSNGMTIEWTTDVPTHVRPKGSVVFNINGSSTSTRGYIATDGAGTWTAITTAA